MERAVSASVEPRLDVGFRAAFDAGRARNPAIAKQFAFEQSADTHRALKKNERIRTVSSTRSQPSPGFSVFFC
jgi:hypothetical protein